MTSLMRSLDATDLVSAAAVIAFVAWMAFYARRIVRRLHPVPAVAVLEPPQPYRAEILPQPQAAPPRLRAVSPVPRKAIRS